MIILQHLFPVFALLALGVTLKRLDLTNETFAKTADKLVYYIFFPVLLFWKIGRAPQIYSDETLRFYLAVIITVLGLYLLSLLTIYVFKIQAFQAGAFSQSCYRFNTYVGMAVIYSVMGEHGVAQFGILIAIIIPIINVLAVSTLLWFSIQPASWTAHGRTLIASILKNPLILGCLAGAAYARWVKVFPTFVESTFDLAASVTLPLALLSIGGGLKMEKVKRHMNLALMSAALKLSILPILGYTIMTWLRVVDHLIALGMIFFALPTSTAVYVLSSQLNSDTEFASAVVVLSTALSFLSLSFVLGWFHG